MSRSISRIYIHTAAAGTTAPVYQSAAVIRAYHVRTLGWSEIGYHWVVGRDGQVEAGRPESRPGAHVEGDNGNTIGVCFAGHGDLADLTPAQKAAGAKLVAEILERYGLTETFIRNPMRVLGHREVNQLIDAGVVKAKKTTKTCPGRRVDCSEFRRLVMQRVMSQEKA